MKKLFSPFAMIALAMSCLFLGMISCNKSEEVKTSTPEMKYTDISEAMMKTKNQSSSEEAMINYLTNKYDESVQTEYNSLQQDNQFKKLQTTNLRITNNESVSIEDVVASSELSDIGQTYLLELSTLFLQDTDYLEELYNNSKEKFYKTINERFTRFEEKLTNDKMVISSEKEAIFIAMKVQQENFVNIVEYVQQENATNRINGVGKWLKKAVTVVVSSGVGALTGLVVGGPVGSVVGGVVGVATGVTMIANGQCYCMCGTCSCSTGKC